MDQRAERLRAAIAALGFDEVRFASAGEPPPDRLTPWLKAGRQADMDWMERTAPRRLSPEAVLPGVKTVVLLGVSYWRDGGAPRPGGPALARYSMYSDYHDTLKPALERAGRLLEEHCGAAPKDYRYYVDTGPVLERGWAARAGAGFIGKNAMLVSRLHGNWLFLAAILTRVELPADPALRGRAGDGPGLLCGKCTRCLDACPTGAFPEPGVVDARRCVSYLTIENRGAIPRELRARIGARVYGCDTCLEVCPWNRFAREGRQMLLASRDELAQLGWRELLELSPEGFAARFRGTPVKRLKYAGLLRNACIGAGNSAEVGLVAPLLRLAVSAPPLVRAHAVWAVRRLAGEGEAPALLGAAREAEADPAVLSEYAGPVDGAL